jgi:hypothetical protein
MSEESKQQAKLGKHFPSAAQVEEFRRLEELANSFKGSFRWLDNPFAQQLQEVQRATQSWQNLMSPALAALNEITQGPRTSSKSF